MDLPIEFWSHLLKCEISQSAGVLREILVQLVIQIEPRFVFFEVRDVPSGSINDNLLFIFILRANLSTVSKSLSFTTVSDVSHQNLFIN